MMSRPTRSQLRRHARRLTRDGYQPMMLINSGSDLPEMATTALVRAIWRYRSELVPIAVAVATFIAANTLHRAHHAAWPWLALATLATIAALAVPPPPWARKTWAMLDHPAERAYAVAITITIGGWLTAAIAVGPATPPMPAIAAALTVACGIPWWTNRRRRAKVRVDRMLDAWPQIANATGLPGSQIMSALVDVWGWRARLRLARGQTINDVISKIPALESGLGTFRGAVRVYPTPDDLANRCELRVLDIDPHADAIPWPGPSTDTITEPIDLGPFEDAATCRVLFLRRHVLFGGATGAGKSGGLNVLMGNLAACQDVVIWASSEFGFLDLADRIATGSSLMPQKKNPDIAELLRGRSGRAIGALTSLATVLKGLPMAYDRDLQEDKLALFTATENALDCLEAAALLVSNLVFNRGALARGLEDAGLYATDSAEALVLAGTPFRQAHHQVAAEVREGRFTPLWGARDSLSKRSLDVPALARSTAARAASLRRWAKTHPPDMRAANPDPDGTATG